MIDLTPRQLEVVSLVAQGLTNKEIAARMGCALQTVKNHISMIMDSWALDNRIQVVLRYQEEKR